MVGKQKNLFIIPFISLLNLAGAHEAPDMIFILADDLGYSDVSFMGQEKIQPRRAG